MYYAYVLSTYGYRGRGRIRGGVSARSVAHRWPPLGVVMFVAIGCIGSRSAVILKIAFSRGRRLQLV